MPTATTHPDWEKIARHWHAKATRRRATAAASPAAAQSYTQARAEAAEVARLCLAAGRPELAADFISAATSLAAVRTALALPATASTSLEAAARRIDASSMWDGLLAKVHSGAAIPLAAAALADSPLSDPAQRALAGVDADDLWTKAFEHARGRVA